MSFPSPTSTSVERFRISLILSANPFSAITSFAHAAMGLNSSTAVTESAPSAAAIMERSPVPVPMSNTCTGSPFERRSLTALRRPS